ncbi:hypothetical protein HC928_09460 [bacterium]|nr:hypothetical protein [bacterium]
MAGLTGGPGGEIYLATVEDFGDLLFYEVWQAQPPFTDRDSDWENLGLPLEAEDSPCAEAHAIIAGPGGEVYYAWAEPCIGRILLAVSLGDGDWFTLDAEITIDGVTPGRPLELAVGPEGIVYVAWIAPTSGINGQAGVGAFLPG